MLECVVKMININLPAKHEILEECRPLYEYAWFIQRVREYQEEELGRDESIRKAILDCQREGIFAEFVREHGTEAVNMLYTQFNMDDALDVRYEEGVEDGIAQGIAEERAKGERLLIRQVCAKLQRGDSPDKIAEDLLADPEQITRICSATETCGFDENAVYEKIRAEE